eukprot:14474490-Alexandrium_andersonii.AAC.1
MCARLSLYVRCRPTLAPVDCCPAASFRGAARSCSATDHLHSKCGHLGTAQIPGAARARWRR